MHSKKTFAWFLAVSLIFVSFGLVGCSDDDPVALDDTDPSPYVWPDTADKLMANFNVAYASMDIEEYENCLHPDFQFIFMNNDSWDRADDVTSTENMFAGDPGEDPDGMPKPGVQSIEIIELTQMTFWDTTLPNYPDFPNTEKALYKVNIMFYLDGGENTITITEQQLFYAVAVEVDQGDGTSRTRFYLTGQQDLAGENKGNEDMTWGGVKALYR